ncbi:hypothetical protein Aple_075630 [Acrocarpospora pleiomorpha]|uniref:Uncharacterized protein n=1 Tax=Acrocarpospora pleiomorpha TaxID=90975 RepID=A0A5M3XTQ7_9ACTN|nr:hypothetical protein Aple_075630 [Acrocarpospora pleiomorpha]
MYSSNDRLRACIGPFEGSDGLGQAKRIEFGGQFSRQTPAWNCLYSAKPALEAKPQRANLRISLIRARTVQRGENMDNKLLINDVRAHRQASPASASSAAAVLGNGAVSPPREWIN